MHDSLRNYQIHLFQDLVYLQLNQKIRSGFVISSVNMCQLVLLNEFDLFDIKQKNNFVS